jgi:hypothetical protein
MNLYPFTLLMFLKLFFLNSRFCAGLITIKMAIQATLILLLGVLVIPLTSWSVSPRHLPEQKIVKKPLLTEDLVLESLKKDGSISHKTNVTLKNVVLIGNVFAGQNLTLLDSEIHGNLKAGGSGKIERSQIFGSINIGKNLTVVSTHVSGSVSVRHHADLKGLDMPNGNIATSSPNLKLTDSRVKNIRMAPRLTSHLYTKGHDGKTHSPHEGYVYLEPGSVLSAGGFHFQSTDKTTSVRTPEGFLYENGLLIKGKAAPTSYAAYRVLHPGTPLVKGPGWPTQPRGNGSAISATGKRTQVILSQSSLVTGQILFDEGNGLVIIEPGSKLTGTVEGGVIQP